MHGTDNLNKYELNKTLRVTSQIWVAVSEEVCFATISRQLEVSPSWDPFIINVRPISITRCQNGASSRILIDIGGHISNCRAIVYQYQPNSCFGWFLTDYPRIWVNWRLTPQRSGTSIGITIAREYKGVLIEKLWWKMNYQRRLERDMGKMLIQFKSNIEKNYQAVL